MKKTLKVTITGFELKSQWRYKRSATTVTDTKITGGKKELTVPTGWKLAYGPTSSSKTVKVKYSLPSGAKIKTARIWAKISSGNSISVCTVNGASFSKKDGSKKGANVTLKSTSGTLSATFKYKATGGLYKDEKTHTGTLKFDNVYLLIEYEMSGEAAKTTPAKPKGLSVPPQTTCIYDQTDGAVYLFDGVTKIQHSLTLDIQEEPDNKKKEYVNNAKNLPDKVTIDVVMSDVYTGGGAMVNKAGKLTAAQNKALNKVKKSILQNGSGTTRSESAFRTLHSLKEKRRKLTVITPLFVYVDMVLASVTTNQDDSSTFGWEGQITFQKAFKPKPKKKKKTSKDTGTNTPPDKVLLA